LGVALLHRELLSKTNLSKTKTAEAASKTETETFLEKLDRKASPW
jgi:hypothetical protein